MKLASFEQCSTPQVAELSPFAMDCLDGLSRTPKCLPCKWLYDDRGSQLFERITALDDYYPARVEQALLETAASDIAGRVADGATLVELGSGASRKTRTLLAALDGVAAYVPIDISATELARAHLALRAAFPDLAIQPLCADFTNPAVLDLGRWFGPILLFFPGSTLGNMPPAQAIDFLKMLRRCAGAGAKLLLGVDLVKDARTLRAAYDDAEGVTAAFNLNLLTRMRRELGCAIDVDAFRHRAVWNAAESRVEMQLAATSRQVIRLAGRSFTIEAGETVHTESSYKLTTRGWREVFASAGWRIEAKWESAAPSFLLALLAGGDA